MGLKLGCCCKDDSLENSPRPFAQRSSPLFPSALLSSLLRPLYHSDVFWNPCSTHLNSPPAVYCVNEYRVSPVCMEVLPWRRLAEGMRIVEPGGNSMTRWRSHNTRCPPRLKSKLPRAVIAHQPKGRFPESVWSKHTVKGPRLKVQHANTLLKKFRLMVG